MADKTSKKEELIAHAIWHTPGVAVYDKRAIADQLAYYLEVNDPADFVRLASDPQYGPGGPALVPSEVLRKFHEKHSKKDDGPDDWEQTPEGSGPVVPADADSRDEEGPTPSAEEAAENDPGNETTAPDDDVAGRDVKTRTNDTSSDSTTASDAEKDPNANPVQNDSTRSSGFKR